MRSDKTQIFSNMTTRQKATVGALVLVVIIVLWQIIGLFGGKNKPAPLPTGANKSRMAMNKNQVGGAPPSPQQMTPQQAELIKPEPTTPRELELIKLQQETQAKYISALNELQMLKVAREIAETNQAIMTAKLATVTAEKNIVGMLSGPTPQEVSAAYAKGLVNPANAAPHATPQVISQPTVNYTVISVTQLRYKWGAVLGYGGNLYNVSVGDVLPADGSTVVSIDKSGVVLEKNGVRKKVSLVPII